MTEYEKARRRSTLFEIAQFIIALAALTMFGCEGWGGKAGCKRNVDGTVECSIELHNDGNHDKPVPKETPK